MFWELGGNVASSWVMKMEGRGEIYQHAPHPFISATIKMQVGALKVKAYRCLSLRQKAQPSQEANYYSCFLDCILGTFQKTSINEATTNILYNTLHISIYEIAIRTLCLC